jgi:hypothetical protein
MRAQFLAGMAVAGTEAEQCFDSELQALQTLVERANDGDVVVVTIAEQLPELEQWLRLQSAVEVDPGQWVRSF